MGWKSAREAMNKPPTPEQQAIQDRDRQLVLQRAGANTYQYSYYDNLPYIRGRTCIRCGDTYDGCLAACKYCEQQ